MATVAYDALPRRVDWHVDRIVAIALAAVALLICGLALGTSIRHGNSQHTQSLTPAATSTSP